MGRAVLYEGRNDPGPDESLIDFLIDAARYELERGIKENYLIEIYEKTYGESLTGRIFSLINR